MCILCIFQLNAQTTREKTIGTNGGTSTVLPMATNQTSSHSQQIYTATELEIPKGSKITSLSFYVSSVPKDKNNATCNNITVSLKNTPSVSFANDAFESTSGSSTATMPNGKFSAGWVTFNTDFTYDGQSLLVDFQGTVADTKKHHCCNIC